MIFGRWFQRKRSFKNWPKIHKFPIIPLESEVAHIVLHSK